MKRSKQNRQESICEVLLDGKQWSPDQIKSKFAGTDLEKILEYKLSYFIHLIRLEGGIVRVVKEKRKIASYQLINFNEFDDKGRYVGRHNVKNVQSEIKQEELV